MDKKELEQGGNVKDLSHLLAPVPPLPLSGWAEYGPGMSLNTGPDATHQAGRRAVVQRQ